jgi:hypothetical protein
MAKREGIFYGEGRVYAFPPLDLNGVPANTLSQVGKGKSPLQFAMDGAWGIYGYSGMYATPASGGVPSGTPVNFNIRDQNTSENYVRASNLNVDLGGPIEHIVGKAGNPAYYSWPKVVEPGARLYPWIGWIDNTGSPATITGRSPWYVVAHSQLLRPGMAAAIPIGSRAFQLESYGGVYAWYTGTFPFNNITQAGNLAVNGNDTLSIPISGKRYFFVDSLWCRTQNEAMGPTSDINPLIAEHELLVSVKDTSALNSWCEPGFVPIWTMFGSRGGRPYCPPAPFVVRPLGNIEINIRNGPTAAFTGQVQFTFGGVLVDIPRKVIEEASILQTQRDAQGARVLIG